MNNEELIKLAQRNQNISDSEINQDILDTQKEIREYKCKIGDYNGRFDLTYNNEIKQRQKLIENLENIKKGRVLIFNIEKYLQEKEDLINERKPLENKIKIINDRLKRLRTLIWIYKNK